MPEDKKKVPAWKKPLNTNAVPTRQDAYVHIKIDPRIRLKKADTEEERMWKIIRHYQSQRHPEFREITNADLRRKLDNLVWQRKRLISGMALSATAESQNRKRYFVAEALANINKEIKRLQDALNK